MYNNDQEYGWKSYDNQGYDDRQYNGAQTGPGFPGGQGPSYNQGPSYDQRPPKKKGGLLKKAALITAGAVLFGTVSGGVMVGVNIAASRYLDIHASADAPASQAANPPATEPDQGQADQKGQDNNGSQQKPNGAAVADVSDIVEEAMPTVVAITSTTVYQSNNFGYGWFFGGPQTYEVPSSGSGIIIGENDKELLIVTNNHVVEESTSLKVSFIDNEVVDAAIK